jgi:anhydro-N-acetylmuramic acid kinase
MIKKEIIGLMSGTSLDGLDIVHVQFGIENNVVSYTIKACVTIPYDSDILDELNTVHSMELSKAQLLDKKIGLFYSAKVNAFITENKIDKKNIEAIASHGQTILHQPENGFTYQIGCGSTLAYHTGIPVINDFRTLDVISGGQGAPLVPLGDFDLFRDQAESYLNIGGFCNISFKRNEIITAFDICPGNLPLNYFAQKLNQTFDRNGELAKSGNLNNHLLESLNSIDYYTFPSPKSLGTEWINSEFYPICIQDLSPQDYLHTISTHIGEQIVNTLNQYSLKSVFITGGGAKNEFLIEQIRNQYSGNVIIPDEQIIDFKEAVIFAYLGFKYLLNQANNVPSVTGADKELCTGVYHKPGFSTYLQK